MQKKVKLQKTNAITVFGAGHQALAEIEGLRGMAVEECFLIISSFLQFHWR